MKMDIVRGNGQLKAAIGSVVMGSEKEVRSLGANRAQRRKQERELIRNWKEKGQYNQVLSLQRNGITEKDLDKAYNDGYQEGYMYASECFLKKIYAACAKELIDAGNTNNSVVSFIRGVDHRFTVMFDADDEIDDVYKLIGVRFNIDRHAIERIEEV